MFVSLFLAAAAQIPPGRDPVRQAVSSRRKAARADRHAGPLGRRGATESDEEKPAPPVRIFGNTYLVGTCGISSILITDSGGRHLDRRRARKQDADLIVANVRKLGFQLDRHQISCCSATSITTTPAASRSCSG